MNGSVLLPSSLSTALKPRPLSYMDSCRPFGRTRLLVYRPTGSPSEVVNELFRRLVHYCSVEDVTLEGAVCCR